MDKNILFTKIKPKYWKYFTKQKKNPPNGGFLKTDNIR